MNTSLLTPVAQNVYTIDGAHSSAQFSVRHLMISNVRGEFNIAGGAVEYDPANPAAAKFEAVLDVNSISTREAKRDDHLKSADFFDAANFPTMEFKSREVRPAGDKLHAKGDLTMHGVTHEVLLVIDTPTPEMKDPWGNLRLGASATTKLNRKDWGLSWNGVLETGGVMVGEEVTITLDIQAVRPAETA